MVPDIKVGVHHVVGPTGWPSSHCTHRGYTRKAHATHVSPFVRMSHCSQGAWFREIEAATGFAGMLPKQCRAAEALPWWLWAFRMAS